MLGRPINAFEKLLLPVGIGVTFFGFYLIILVDKANSQIAWAKLTALFMWMILLFTVIVTATTEDVKEELAIIQREHVTEIKLLREITFDQLQEIKLLRQDLSRKKK